MRIPARVPPMRRIPVRNRIDGIAAANSPVNASSGRIDGSRSGYVSAVPAPVTSPIATLQITVVARTTVIACEAGTVR